VFTGDGSDTVSVMRFRQDSIVVRVGDTVEWTNLDPATAHMVTFGFPNGDPAPPQLPAPAGLVSVDSDGARHAERAKSSTLPGCSPVAADRDPRDCRVKSRPYRRLL
jgi:hypothetical protein